MFRSSFFLLNKTELFSIKKKLNKLYLNVHPDFFEDFPKQKKINEQSLSLLQNFMEEYKAETDIQLTSKTYNFQFYLKNEAEKLIQLSLNGLKIFFHILEGPQPNTGFERVLKLRNFGKNNKFKS
jgi:hypothetical protein